MEAPQAKFSGSAPVGGIPTMDNIRRRNIVIINAYTMCLADTKSVNHLLLNHRMENSIWKSVLQIFNVVSYDAQIRIWIRILKF